MKVDNINKQSDNWSVDVDGNHIRVENKFSTTKLFVNDKLQDVFYGMFGAVPHLTGSLPDGKRIKASVGGDVRIHCSIFVDDEVVIED